MVPAPAQVPRCQVMPLPDQRVEFLIDGMTRTQWHFGPAAPRPFFYPVLGPAGVSLTRMGHPGDFSHEHHRSVWFAHHDVEGGDFWGEHGRTTIRQKRWLAYLDSNDECGYACLLGWYDSHAAELMEQELVIAVRPAEGATPEAANWELELTSEFRPRGASVTLGKTNFGLLAVRVAKTISGFFGGGTISNSEGLAGERAIFSKPARWMDYSGPVAANIVAGITYFDHPANPRYPSAWHVREDGWMGSSLCLNEPLVIEAAQPLRLRYLLHIHPGGYDPELAAKVAAAFAKRPPLSVVSSPGPHRKLNLQRKAAS